MSREFEPGDIVQHFKRESVVNQAGKEYLYQIIGLAKTSETQEKVVVYKALYGTQEIWVRPYDMFMSEVDTKKYPGFQQKYRFEKFETDISTIKKNATYGDLCEYVKSEYLKVECQNLQKNSCETYLTGCDWCDEINLWTYWQGRGVSSPRIMLIGQDWGCPDVELKNRIEKCKKQLLSPQEDKKEYYFAENGASQIDFATDKNLVDLFRSVDDKYQDISTFRYDDLFFTNICLGYRNQGASGGYTTSWITEIERSVYPQLLRILKPKLIICLGRQTYESFLNVMNKKDKRKRTPYNDFIEANNKNPFMIGEIPVFSFAHCGAMGTLNRNDKKDNSLSKQIEDWKYIKKYI